MHSATVSPHATMSFFYKTHATMLPYSSPTNKKCLEAG